MKTNLAMRLTHLKASDFLDMYRGMVIGMFLTDTRVPAAVEDAADGGEAASDEKKDE